jgi:type IX secretion system PorP/SprF family membrane protein
MKSTLAIYFSLLLIFSNTKSEAQQDINFSQFYELPLLRNPALAGIFNGNVRLTAAYRNQWQSVTVPYRTMALGAEMKYFKGLAEGDFMTIGIQITNDEAGDSKLKRTQFLPVLNYHKLLNETYNTMISLAFMGGMVSQSFDASKLKFDDQFVNGSYSASNPTSQQFSKTGFNYYDISTGLSFSTDINSNNKTKIYFGGGLFHFNSPRLTFMNDNNVRLNKKWVINAGLTTYTNTNNKLVVYVDHFIQGGNRLTQGGFLYTHNLVPTENDKQISISGGLVYRLNDALIPILKINSDKLGVGFSYDANVSGLKTASNYRGGFEITLSFMDLWEGESMHSKQTKCPANNW